MDALPAGFAAFIATHPGVSGVVLTHAQALRLGVDSFGGLLDE